MREIELAGDEKRIIIHSFSHKPRPQKDPGEKAMSATIQATIPDLRSELVNWRQRLEATAQASNGSFQLNGLLREVQSAIENLTRSESYGVCQV